MTHHHARLVAVAIAAVSFSTPLYAQQEPTPSPTVETLVETLGGRVSGLQGTVQRIKVTNGEVVEVVLIGDQVTDASLAHLTGLTALNYLRLRDTQITDAGLAHLAGLPVLATLDLRDTQITDAGVAHLTGLPSLQSLVLYKTEVTAAGLVHFQKMPALRRLELDGPQTESPRFTDADIANLREALPNVRIHDGAPVAPPPPPPPPPQ